MSLNSREKKLLILLAVVLVGYLLYTFAISPLMSQYDTITKEHEQLVEQRKQLEENLMKEEEVDQLIGDYKEKIESLNEQLPPIIHQEKAMNLLFDIFEANDIDVSSYSYSYSSELPKYNENEKSTVELLNNYEKGELENLDQLSEESDGANKDGANGKSKEINTKNLASFNVGVSFKAEYNDFKKLIIALEENRSKIVIKNISMSRAGQTSRELELTEQESEEDFRNIISGSLSIQLPYYYDNEKIDIQDVEFVYTNQNIGNFNPFYNYDDDEMEVTLPPEEYIVGGNQNETEETNEPTEVSNNEQTSSVSADFTIELNSAQSPLPAVSINKTPYKYTSLFIDNNSFETVSLTIDSSDGRNYFKYSNGFQSFPRNDMMEFNPRNDGTIIIEVFSNDRSLPDDNSGAILQIDNRSGRKVIIYSYNDDNDEPRLEVQNLNGNYELIKE